SLGRGWPRGVRRHKRPGADDGRRRQDAGLLHQPDRLRGSARRGAAAPDRPGVQRDRLCPAQALCGTGRTAARGLGGGRPPTPDLKAALRGALLAFGGARGANVALMVEVMAAGLTGANWALDAPSFTSGESSPGAGLLVIAITPSLLAPDFPERLRLQLDRL